MEGHETHTHDIIIVGAGPCGLAVTARLCEPTPSALFTDSEHQRYHWMKSSASSKRTSKPTRTSRRSHTAADRLLSGRSIDCNLDIAVLDASGDQWMSAWDSKFKSLGIEHLRSPMFFHPDPRDRDGLLEFAYREGREKELREIKGVVGKGLSKHQRKQKVKNSAKRSQECTYIDERARNDYFRPSQSLFSAHCSSITSRYKIQSIVQKSSVTSIVFCTETSSFTLQTSTGIKRARIVVFAAGAASKPSIPTDSPFLNLLCEDSVSHAFSKDVFPPSILHKVKQHRQTSLAVIGGGLTAAQVVHLAAKLGVSKIYHIMRGSLKVKHFDVDLGWVGKYKNFWMAGFWGLESEQERFESTRDAKGGGSVTPEYKKILELLIKGGRVDMKEKNRIVSARREEDGDTWELELEVGGKLKVDGVVYATGVPADFESIDALRLLRDQAPLKTVGGLPCLTDDLMWDKDIPFFFTGRLAGLRLGPAAGNLEGARQGAERVVGQIGELLGGVDERDSGYGSADEDVDRRRLGLGFANQFGVLEVNEGG